jgi:hypothetical protein
MRWSPRASSDPSAVFYDNTMTIIRWLRVPGDTIFAIGALAMGVFMVGLLTGWSIKKDGRDVETGSVTAIEGSEGTGGSPNVVSCVGDDGQLGGDG